jgi:hypothetical protein
MSTTNWLAINDSLLMTMVAKICSNLLDAKSIWTVFAGPVIASRFVINLLAAIKIVSYEDETGRPASAAVADIGDL